MNSKRLPLDSFIRATTIGTEGDLEQNFRRGPEGQKIYDGHIMFEEDGIVLEPFIPEGMIFVESWSKEPHVYVWASKPEAEHNAFIVWCEGDVQVSVHESFESFQKEHARAEQSYVGGGV